MNTPENKRMPSDKHKNSGLKEEESKRKFVKKLALHLKRIRKEKKITQEELAFQAGLNSAYIGHIERGIYSPTLFVIWKISKALGMNLKEFLTDFPQV